MNMYGNVNGNSNCRYGEKRLKLNKTEAIYQTAGRILYKISFRFLLDATIPISFRFFRDATRSTHFQLARTAWGARSGTQQKTIHTNDSWGHRNSATSDGGARPKAKVHRAFVRIDSHSANKSPTAALPCDGSLDFPGSSLRSLAQYPVPDSQTFDTLLIKQLALDRCLPLSLLHIEACMNLAVYLDDLPCVELVKLIPSQ